MLFSLLAGRGGGGEEEGIGAEIRWRRWPYLHRALHHADGIGVAAVSGRHGGPSSSLLHPGAHHMVDIVVAMISGTEGHQSRCFDGASTTSKTEALDGDLDRRHTPPNHQVVCPRWLVAGGRMRDPDDEDGGGEDPVLDCVPLFFAGSFFLISEDQSITFFFFRVLLVFCTHRLR